MGITRFRGRQIEDNTVTSADITDHTITADDIAAGSLDGAMFVDGSIPAEKFDLTSFPGPGLSLVLGQFAVNVDNVDLEIVADVVKTTTLVTKQGNTFNLANMLVQLDGAGHLPVNALYTQDLIDITGTVNTADGLVRLDMTGKLPALDGSQLTNLPIFETLASSDLSDVEGAVNTANGLVKLDGAGKLPALDGSALTNLSISEYIATSDLSDVEGAVNTANGLVKLDGTGLLPALDGSALTNLAAGSTGAVQFNTSNSLDADDANLFWDNTSKRLGIGTAAPIAKLHIVGSLQIDGDTSPSSVSITGGNDASNGGNVSLAGGSTTGIAGGYISLDGGIGSGPGTNGGSAYLRGGSSAAAVGGSVYVLAGNAPYAGNVEISAGSGAPQPGYVHIKTSGIDRIMVDPSGNVGIGIASPDSPLHVVGATDTDAVKITDGTFSTMHFQGTATPFNGMRIIADGTMYLATGGGDGVIVDQFGNVGIGQYPPDAKLHVAGAVKIVDGSQQANYVLTSDANGLASWQAPYITTPAGADTQIQYNSSGVFGASSDFLLTDYIDSGASVRLLRATNPSAAWGELRLGSDAGVPTRLYAGPSWAALSSNFDPLSSSRFNTGESSWAFTMGFGYSDEWAINHITAAGVATAPLRVTSNDEVLATGNVGIGTVVPDTKLHIVGSIKMVDTFQTAGHVLTSDADGVGKWQVPAVTGAAGANTQIQFNSSGAFGADSNLVWNNTSKLLGIGTSTPDTIITAYSNAAIPGSNIQIISDSGSPNSAAFRAVKYGVSVGNNAGVSLRTAQGTQAAPAASLSGDSLGFINARGYDGGTGGTGFGAGQAAVNFSASAAWSPTNRSTAMNFQTTPQGTAVAGVAASVTRMTITDSGAIGIGTGGPTSTLHISQSSGTAIGGLQISTATSSTSSAASITSNGTTGGTAGLRVSMPVGTNNMVAGLASVQISGLSPYIRLGTEDWRMYVDNTDGAKLKIGQSGAIGITVQHVGAFDERVGIGIATPDTRLHVSGSIKIVDATQGLNKVLTSDSAGLASWTNRADTSGSTGDVQYSGVAGAHASNPIFHWDNTNNRLGIGTATPSFATLDVQRTSGVELIHLQNNAASGFGWMLLHNVDGSLSVHEQSVGNHLDIAAGGAATFSAALTVTGQLNLLADADAGGYKLRNAADPLIGTDLATKQYVDSIATGLSLKASVRVATTANITLSGAQTIDTIPLTGGERVLVKDQSLPEENGIYIVVDPGAWTRSTDADNTPGSEVNSGMYTFVQDGSANINNGYVLVTQDPITLDVTPLTFSIFAHAPAVEFVDRETPSGAMDSSNVTYTLAYTPILGSEHLYKNGILQDEGSGNGYTISGDTITMTTAPTATDKLRISYRK